MSPNFQICNRIHLQLFKLALLLISVTFSSERTFNILIFQRFTDADIDEMLERECWIKANCVAYKTERDAADQERMAQSGKYKRYKRYMKNAGTISFVDED